MEQPKLDEAINRFISSIRTMAAYDRNAYIMSEDKDIKFNKAKVALKELLEVSLAPAKHMPARVSGRRIVTKTEL